MKEISQDKFSQDPTPESRGNCQQAAIASILGIELHAVPSFQLSPEGFWCAFNNFLESLGYRTIELPGDKVPDVFYLAYGKSLRGTPHTCIYRKGLLIWDPHPSRLGLVKVEVVALIVPVDPSFAMKSHKPIEAI